VWEAEARAPSWVKPTFQIMTGFLSEALLKGPQEVGAVLMPSI